jgi:D-3-phosphoglycerate dehydrogenase / 2-oxoglutarate reductase
MSDANPIRILITQPLPVGAIEWLQAQGSLLYLAYEDEKWRSVADQIRALVYYSIPIDKPLMDQLPSLEVIGKRGAGIDSVDLEEAERRGILVTNVAGANANSVSEHAVMLLFAATRGVLLRDRVTRAGGFQTRFELPLVREIAETRLGLIGFGNIGRRIADMFRLGFSCEIGFYDPYADLETIRVKEARRFDDLSSLMAWADNAIVAAPLTPETRGMVGRDELDLLGPDGVIVVISRGGIVDEEALAAALTEGSLNGAGIDTYDREPPRSDHPLYAVENAVLTPHVAGASDTSRERSSLLVCQRVWALLHGEDAPVVGAQSWLR